MYAYPGLHLPPPPHALTTRHLWQTVENKTKNWKEANIGVKAQNTTIHTYNRFLPLSTYGSLRCHNGNNDLCVQDIDDDKISGIVKGIAPTIDKTPSKYSVKGRPQVVINNFPECEMYFKRRKPVPVVPGYKKYSEAV